MEGGEGARPQDDLRGGVFVREACRGDPQWCIQDFSWFVYISLYADVRVELILLDRAEAKVGEVGARLHAKLGLEDVKVC